ncbi:eotaxin-like [Megalops cyprinoides]|uniref:eotaxin-like n=1 Tax=Megalops cyprinoides TaxID=118141 RepID=UPI0018646134|nr:eotaxin-like [Megalops cyprinoides]
MAQFNLSTVCLLLVLAVSLFTLQAESACCTKYSRAELPKSLIKGFSVQNIGLCNINAVIFHTRGGRKVCADPAKPWVMDMIQELRSTVESMSSQTQGQ